MAPVGFAVLGLGALAQTAILPAFRNMQTAKLVAVISRDREKARRLGEVHGAAFAYDSLDECLANSQVEAVYIATPPGNHLQEAKAVALAGRHVLCEKPLAVTAPEAAEMVATCARQSVLLMTAYRKCFEPSMVFIRDLILSGRVGALKILHTSFSERHAHPQISPPWILDRRLAGGGPLMDLGIYCVHAARWLAGEIPSSVSAFQWTHDRSLFREVEEGIAFSMYFPSGLVAQASTCYSAALSSMLYLEGTLGSVSLTPAFPYEQVRVLDARFGSELVHEDFPVVDEFRPQIDAFAQAIRGGAIPPSCGRDGYVDMAIIEAIYRAARTGIPQAVELHGNGET
jgi:predicted dehydrogenase